MFKKNERVLFKRFKQWSETQNQWSAPGRSDNKEELGSSCCIVKKPLQTARIHVAISTDLKKNEDVYCGLMRVRFYFIGPRAAESSDDL